MRIRMRRLLHHGSRGFHFVQTDIVRTDNGNDNAVRHIDRGFQQRAGNRHACCFRSLIFPSSAAGTDMCITCILHNRCNIREVQIDKARNSNQLRYIRNRLTEYTVRDLKCILKGDLLLGYVLKTLVRDDNQRVNILVEFVDTAERLFQTLLALKCKRTSHNANRQDAHFTSNLRHHRRRAGTGAAAHAGSDKYHMCVGKRRSDLILAFLCCLAADFRVCARALTLCQLFANLDLGAGLRIVQRLHIRVDRNKLNTLHTTFDHAVDRVAAATAYADYFNVHYIIQALFKLETHYCHPPFYDKESFRLSYTFSCSDAAVYRKRAVPIVLILPLIVPFCNRN